MSRSAKRLLLRSFAIGALVTGLSGCDSTPLATYDLKPSAAPAQPLRAASRAVLAVPRPMATLILDSQRIAIKPGSDLAYLKGAQWPQKLPEVIQSRLIASFASSRGLSAVSAATPETKYTLETDIRHFEADVAHNEANIEIYARLTGARGEIVADRSFKATAAAPHDDAASVTAALDEALGQVLRQIVAWAASKA